MKPWREGDPIGVGEVFLPDSKTRKAYASACGRQWLESAARHVLSLPSLERRRAFIAKHPEQEDLKRIIRNLWEESK